MPVWLYMVVMLGIIAVVGAVSVPSLLRQKCPKCGQRNLLDAKECTACKASLVDAGQP